MKNPEIEKLIKFIEKDIRKLKEYISQKYTEITLDIQRSEFDILDFNLFIDYEYFKGIVETECYRLGSPVFSAAGTKLIERLQLFSKIFLSNLGVITSFHIHRKVSTTGISDFEQSLFMNLLFAIFRRHLITDNKIEDIFLKFLDIWDNFIMSEKAPINIGYKSILILMCNSS